MTGERARLFVALELPGSVRDALARWRAAALEEPGQGVRPVRPEDLHVTLCFLGWQDMDQLAAIVRACAVAGGHGTVELAAGEAALLPRQRPRVLVVALEDVDASLAVLQAALSEALETGGFYEPESRPFCAHVTVARAGRGACIPRTAVLAPSPDALRFRASTVALYRSHLRRGGARYEPLGRIAL